MAGKAETLRDAIKKGRLTEQQVMELITAEAAKIHLSPEEAIERAKQRSLPNNYIGADLSLLVRLLATS